MGQFDGVVVWAGVSKKKFAQKNEQKISLYIMGQFDGVVVWARLSKWFFFEKKIHPKLASVMAVIVNVLGHCIEFFI